MKIDFESTVCSECSLPPNHSINPIGSKDKAIQRFSIKCRDCGDSWEETSFLDKDQ